MLIKIFGVFFILTGVYFTIINFFVLCRKIKGKSAYAAPLLGGGSIAFGFYLFGGPLEDYWLLPLLLDYGCLPLLLHTIYFLIFHARRDEK